MELDVVEKCRADRVRRNEAEYRRFVESIVPLLQLVSPFGPLRLRCECGTPGCRRVIDLDLDAYRLARMRPFLICRRGHGEPEDPRTRRGRIDLIHRTRSWNATVDRLASDLRRLVEDGDEKNTYIVVEADPDRNIYVQFALQGGRLWCEAVQNGYLSSEHALSEVQIVRLIRRGFQMPTRAEANWYRVYEAKDGIPFRTVSQMALGLVTEVYGVRAGLPVNIYASFNEWPKNPDAPHPALILMPFLHPMRNKRNQDRGRRGGGPW